MNRTKSERGFCCLGQVELMITVAIIGIIAAIAIPKFAELYKRYKAQQAPKPAVVSPVERAR